MKLITQTDKTSLYDHGEFLIKQCWGLASFDIEAYNYFQANLDFLVEVDNFKGDLSEFEIHMEKVQGTLLREHFLNITIPERLVLYGNIVQHWIPSLIRMSRAILKSRSIVDEAYFFHRDITSNNIMYSDKGMVLIDPDSFEWVDKATMVLYYNMTAAQFTRDIFRTNGDE